MSAWIVTSAHIDVLVLAGVQFAVPYDWERPVALSPAALCAVGTDLWAENHRSVNSRYGNKTQPAGYGAPTAEVILERVAVVKTIDCFVYQSCERPDWSTSRAADYCRRLRAAAMTGLKLDSDERYPVGWDDAPWGIDHLGQAAVDVSAIARHSS